MISFDDLTLGEVEHVRRTCLDGKSMADPTVDPLLVSGAMMWIVQRRDDPNLDWPTFRDTVRMADIKAFTTQLEAEVKADPTNALSLRAS